MVVYYAAKANEAGFLACLLVDYSKAAKAKENDRISLLSSPWYVGMYEDGCITDDQKGGKRVEVTT